MEERLALLERELELIKTRNVRVDGDKAWERSYFRIAAICCITYCVTAALLYVIHTDGYLIDAVVPPLGFFLSAQSLPALKRWWIKHRYTALP